MATEVLSPIQPSQKVICPGVQPIAQDLLANKRKLDDSQPVTDCGVKAPRLNSSADKKTGIAHKLAFTLFPPEDPNNKAKRTYSYIQYSQLISSLSKAYNKQLAEEEKERAERERINDAYRQARVYGNQEVFESLLDAPIGDPVLHPEPMPVEIAPSEDLAPFFSRMRENKAATQECEEYKRGAYYDDGRIDMCKQVPGPTHIGAMIRSIESNPHVKHFLMGNSIVGLEGAKEISKHILNRPEIETWYLAGNRIDIEGTRLIAEALANDTHCKALWLKRNPLMAEGVKHIGKMLETNQHIEILDLVNVGCLDEGVKYLFNSLRKNTTLKLLYLDANGITPKGAEYIAEYFEYMVKHKKVGITSLFLAINRLDNPGTIRLAKAIQGYKALTHLDLASNRVRPEGLKAVLEAVKDHPDLVFLDFGLYKSTSDMKELPNYLGDEGATILAEFIKTNRTVQIMSIQDANVSPEGLSRIIEAVEQNDTLRFIYAGQYGYCTPKPLLARLWAHLDKNCLKHEGMDVLTYRKDRLRLVKHTERVKDIDSIYRNNM